MYAAELRQTPDGARGVEGSPPSSHAYAAADARQRSNSHTGMPPSPHYHHQRSVPTSPTATRLPPQPLSPTATRERSGSGYYDPTSEARTPARDHTFMNNPYQQVCEHVHYNTLQKQFLLTPRSSIESLRTTDTSQPANDHQSLSLLSFHQ